MALERHGAKLDASPQGKRIVAIDIDVLDVFEDRDPMFNFVNVFHANTKDYVIRRELLFKKDQLYTQKKIQESERNIRNIRQQVPGVDPAARHRRPRDRCACWLSPRTSGACASNSDYRIQNGQLEFLLLQPAEENLGEPIDASWVRSSTSRIRSRPEPGLSIRGWTGPDTRGVSARTWPSITRTAISKAAAAFSRLGARCFRCRPRGRGEPARVTRARSPAGSPASISSPTMRMRPKRTT